MKNLTKVFIGILFLTFGGKAVFAQTVSDMPARQEASKVMADLRLNYGQLKLDQKDLAMAQQEMTTPFLTAEKRKALEDRMQKDQANIRDDSRILLSDLSFLLSNWSYLTQDDKDFVTKVEDSV